MSDNQYNDNNHDAKISKNLLSFLSKKVDWITKELTTRQSISLLLGYPVIYPGEYHPKHDESTKRTFGIGEIPPPYTNDGMHIVPTSWILKEGDCPYKGWKHWLRIITILVIIILFITGIAYGLSVPFR